MQTRITAFMVICLSALTLAGCGSDSSAPVASSSSVVVKNAALPVGTNGAGYTTTLGASGGTAPYKWSIVTGNLPAGLILNTDGNINGTPTAVGTYTVVFKVTDSSVPALVDQKPLQINVSTFASVGYVTPTFTTISLPAATLGVPYSQTLTARDGTLPYKWSTMGGDSIPAGLSLNYDTGVLSGTPTAVGTSNVVFMLEDANSSTMVHQEIAVTVNASAQPPDGVALYASLCASCHNPLATSTKKGRSATTIQSAINNNVGGKQSITAIKALTPAEVSAIATALQ
jgi:cytochrome c5